MIASRYRLSFAAILTAITALTCCGCGSGKTPIHPDDPPAVVALKKAGADVELKPSMAAKDMKGWSADLAGTSLDEQIFEHLGNVEGLLTIVLKGSSVNDDVLARLPEIKSVLRVDLTGAAVTDEGVKHLQSLPALVTVNLTDTKVTGAGLSELSPRLSGLLLNNLPIDDTDLSNLAHIKGLSMLGLVGTDVTPDGVRKFKKGRPFLLTVGVKLN